MKEKKKGTMLKAIGLLLMIIGTCWSIWGVRGGSSDFMQFVSAAAPWVTLGCGVACVLAGSAKA